MGRADRLDPHRDAGLPVAFGALSGAGGLGLQLIAATGGLVGIILAIAIVALVTSIAIAVLRLVSSYDQSRSGAETEALTLRQQFEAGYVPSSLGRNRHAPVPRWGWAC